MVDFFTESYNYQDLMEKIQFYRQIYFYGLNFLG